MLFLLMDMADTPEDKIKVEALYKEYDRLMYYVAGKILRQKEDIEDAIMDAWIKIIQNIHKISEIKCPQTKSFLVIIVERTSIDIYNKKKKTDTNEIAIDEYEQSPFFSTSDTMIEEVEVYDVFKKLPKIYSEVLIMYYMHDLTTVEIASILNISKATVEKRLQRGRQQLEKYRDKL